MNELPIHELKRLGTKLTLLYAEDDKDASKIITSLLQELFSKVVSVSNGSEALEKLKEKSYDILLTDIQMPIIDGLELAKSAKSINREQSIIILTAYEDTKYYSKAIDIGVDNFVLKPVKSDQLFDVLYRVAKKIVDTKDAEFYRIHLEKRVKEETEKNRAKDKIAIEMLESLIDAYPNPTILYSNLGEIRFVNRSFRELFSFEIEKDFKLETILLNYKHTSSENIHIINTVRGKKIFWLITKELQIDKIEHKLHTLIDVSIFERQRLQIKQLNFVLKEYIIDTKYKKQPNTLEVDSYITNVYTLDENSKNILRKNHKDKKSAKEFIKYVEQENIEDIDEILDSKAEVWEKFEKFEYVMNLSNIYELADSFNRFAKSINRFIDFSDISYAILTLSRFLSNLDEDKIQDKDLSLMARYIKSILVDFDKWEKSIFVDRDSIDINYMDSSLLNSCLQVELDFFEQEHEREDDDSDDVMMF